MDSRLPRRTFLRASSLGLVSGLAGCGALQPSNPTPTETVPPGSGQGHTITGTVDTLSGEPVGNARVTAVVGGDEPVAETTTNRDGRFSLDSPRSPVWIAVRAPDYLPRTVAGSGASSLEVALTPEAGTVSMRFGGDVMFGRRFYEEARDPLDPRFQIRPSERLSDHKPILRFIKPLTQDADITAVNLETPLTTSNWRHPTKQYSFVSHPVAATALAEAGIDYAALGNNHTFDALQPGLDETLRTLDSADLSYSGAGATSNDAWEPAYVDVRGVTVVLGTGIYDLRMARIGVGPAASQPRATADYIDTTEEEYGSIRSTETQRVAVDIRDVYNNPADGTVTFSSEDGRFVVDGQRQTTVTVSSGSDGEAAAVFDPDGAGTATITVEGDLDSSGGEPEPRESRQIKIDVTSPLDIDADLFEGLSSINPVRPVQLTDITRISPSEVRLEFTNNDDIVHKMNDARFSYYYPNQNNAATTLRIDPGTYPLFDDFRPVSGGMELDPGESDTVVIESNGGPVQGDIFGLSIQWTDPYRGTYFVAVS